MDGIQDYTVVCQGGLDDRSNFIELSRNTPGAATRLVNFEPGLYGGYRRVSGYEYHDANNPSVNPTIAEGQVLGIIIYKNEIYAARKLKSGDTYGIFKLENSGWEIQTLGFTLNSFGVYRIRHEVFNYGDGEKLCFVDGVNPATIFDGTNWSQITIASSGLDFDNAGGDQALEKPSWVESFQGHLFLGADTDNKSVVCHSAPRKEYDFTVANGAGQVIPGWEVNSMKIWRDSIYLFSANKIGTISVVGTGFVFKTIADDIGCVAPDTLVEINGDLIFLSQDGFRPISGTERIGDIELATLSKKIQRILKNRSDNTQLDQITSVVVKQKSQVRFFFNSSGVSTDATRGILLGFRENGSLEWSELVGFQAICTCQGLINNREVILHGDYSGNVFRQESGDSFNGSNINAVYTTPFLDIDTPLIRKTFRKIHTLVEPEGDVDITATITYDWNNPKIKRPKRLVLEAENRNPNKYDDPESLYSSSVYGASVYPVLIDDTTGSGGAISISFFSDNQKPSYAIQTIIMEYSVRGRR